MKTFLKTLFISLLIFSCNKEKKKEINKTTTLDSLFVGEKLICNENFVSNIEKSCNVFDESEQNSEFCKGCILNKSNYESNFNRKLQLLKLLHSNQDLHKNLGEINLFFNQILVNDKYYDTYTETKTSTQFVLETYIKNKKIDSLVVFEHIDQVDFSYYITKNFYLENTNYLWTLEILVGEEKVKILNWKKYFINQKTGEIKLINEYVKNKNIKNKINISEIWKGNYNFEAIDKENNKTSFSIKIQDLNNISVQIIYSPDEIENYKNIIAEVIEDNKIKIIFNPKLNDGENKMGEIFITNNGSDYFISGEPIYFINPGNDNLELKKLK